ncbi:MAG: SHOCT domain-containing protein [Deltaproteobacteria bacterium]|nr:SHOCT domain-containing protein [Deltaproteobacteria bacterium]
MSFYKGSQKDFERAEQLIEERRLRARTPVIAPASPADEIAKLADLKAKGILAEDEFVAKKKQLFGI